MVKFKYKAYILRTGYNQDKALIEWEEQLNAYGRDGWELVTMSIDRMGLTGWNFKVFLKKQY